MKNFGNGLFVDVAMAVGADSIKDARAAAVADFDNDGDLDIAVNNNPGIGTRISPVLYRNDVGQNQNWLQVDLIGRQVNRDAAGSEVWLEMADGSQQLRHIMIGSAYASQSSARWQFGLGEASEIPKLKVVWKGPGGGEDVFENIQANRVLRIQQGRPDEKARLEVVSGPIERISGSYIKSRQD
jgi:hypothetical protein